MKLRSRELYIIVGVVAAVVGVLWYFFLYSPEQKKVADLNTQLVSQQNALQQTQMQIRQLLLVKKTAPQAEADLIKLHEVIPSEAAIPSFVRAITQTAQDSGLVEKGITTQATAAGVPFSVQPIQLEFDGRYFDVEDFLYRVENYVNLRNGQFSVTGRMFSVVSIGFTKSMTQPYPDLDIKITINGYQWTPSGNATALAGAQ
jgi:Tfp pilus assembly protein PilO